MNKFYKIKVVLLKILLKKFVLMHVLIESALINLQSKCFVTSCLKKVNKIDLSHNQKNVGDDK